jgi:hypothetical protein
MRNAEQFNPHSKGKPNNISERGDYGHRPYGVRSSAGGGKQMGSPIGKGFPLTGEGNPKATGGRFAKTPGMSPKSKAK